MDAGVDSGTPTPLYALAGTNTTPDGVSSYVTVVGSLDAGTAVDYAKVLEAPGQAGIIGPEAGGYFLVGSDTEPSLTRYDVDDTGFHQGAKISFSAYGVVAGAASPQRAAFVSKTQMFYLSRFTPSVFEIDPSAMTITKHIALDELTPAKVGAPESFTFIYDGMIFRDGKLFVYGEMWDLKTSASYPVSRVAVIDTASGAVTYTTDTRCGGLIWMAQGPDGALYGSTVLGAFNFIQRPATPGPCVLRIAKGATEFDANYYADMKANFSQQVSATVFFDDQGAPWTFTLPFAEAPVSEIQTKGVRGFYATNAFRWTKLKADMTPIEQEAPLKSGLIVSTWTMGGAIYVPTLTKIPLDGNQVDSTKLYRFENGAPVEAITFRGVSYGAVRVR
jgi:hypothetical protein